MNKYKKAFMVLKRNFCLDTYYPLPSEITITLSEDDRDFQFVYDLLNNRKSKSLKKFRLKKKLKLSCDVEELFNE